MRKTLLDKTLSPLNKFIHYENSAGIVLFSSVLLAIIWANSPWAESYQNLLNLYFGLGFDGYELRYSLQHWVNDGLMAMFFFLVGLELKREIIDGELSTMKKTALPFAAAMGGMVVPALIYWAINYDLPSVRGWGIPMATDIVFALALLSLAVKGVPVAAKVRHSLPYRKLRVRLLLNHLRWIWQNTELCWHQWWQRYWACEYLKPGLRSKLSILPRAEKNGFWQLKVTYVTFTGALLESRVFSQVS